MYYFIINPSSQTGNGKVLWNKLKAAIHQEGIPYKAFFTSRQHTGSYLAEKICDKDLGVKTIVVVGGDGTLNEVINGIPDFNHVILGYIPTGSGNDFSRGVGISRDPLKALHAILHPKSFHMIDCGTMQMGNEKSRRFLISSGMGYDASICHKALTSPLKTILNRFRLGKLTYILLAIKQLIKTAPFDASIEINGEKNIHRKQVLFLAAMNERFEGGGLLMAPNASDRDGLLSVCIVSGLSKTRVLFLMPLIFFGKHTLIKGVEIIPCRSMRVHASSIQYIHTDGEVPGASDCLLYTIDKQIVRILKSED
ncbi:MAG: diacylglycerol kinase family lipid kinase [Lachnospiraceae bacterium]|nr:diacylglycerol kinase family lipid kinase [Lachnospiraceae bacterium]